MSTSPCIASIAKPATANSTPTISSAASSARAEESEIKGDYGGILALYQAKWSKLAEQHTNIRISGPCVSACTS